MKHLLAVLLAAIQGGVVTGHVRVAGRGAADVLVVVRAGLPARVKYQAPIAPVVFEIRGCRAIPRVAGIQVGQALEIHNGDAMAHRIATTVQRNRPFDVVVPAGGRVRRVLASPELAVELQCDARVDPAATIAVLTNPFFAVTGGDGSFTLRGLPPGTYTLEARHEHYGTDTATLTVAAGGTVIQDFRFARR